MEKTKANLIIMSHLSDAQECIGVGMSQESAYRHINFIKYLIFHLGGDLTTEIDADDWWNKFQKNKTNDNN